MFSGVLLLLLFYLFLVFILLDFFWASWICGWVFDINLGEIVGHYFFKDLFCYFLSYLVLLPYVCFTFFSCPTVLKYSGFLFVCLFCFSFLAFFCLLSVLEVSIEIFSCSDSVLSHSQSNKPIKVNLFLL